MEEGRSSIDEALRQRRKPDTKGAGVRERPDFPHDATRLAGGQLNSGMRTHPIADRPNVGIVMEAGPRLDVAKPAGRATTNSQFGKPRGSVWCENDRKDTAACKGSMSCCALGADFTATSAVTRGSSNGVQHQERTTNTTQDDLRVAGQSGAEPGASSACPGGWGQGTGLGP